jgi:hypothetical protein
MEEKKIILVVNSSLLFPKKMAGAQPIHLGSESTAN